MPNTNPKLFNNNPTRPYQQQQQQPNMNNYSGMMTQSQNVSANYSQLGINSNNPPQTSNKQFNNNEYGFQNNRQSNPNGPYMNNFQGNNSFFNQNYPNGYPNNFQNNNNMNFLSSRGQQMPQQMPQPPMMQLP
jgi:hypothetical protein